jgi:poly(hydroxyalkanoate) depolymerase family esterase
MIEATRLTREGKLKEAMAVLLGSPDAANGPAPASTERDPRQEAEGDLNVIDMAPPSIETGNAWTAPKSGKVSSAAALDGKLGPAGRLDAMPGRVARPAPAAPPDGASFEEYSFTNEAGSRTYKLYVPSHQGGRALPLVVMLHGCTQSPDDFAVGTRMNELAEEQRFLVAYPAQPQSANPSKCWNWFNGTDQRRDYGEPSLIAGITRQIIRDFPIELGRVYVAGLSAGGATAAIMGATYPDLYAAIGVHSGLACGAARDVTSAFVAMRQGGAPEGDRAGTAGPIVPTIVFHGDRDRTVNPANGDQVIAQAKGRTNLRATVVHGKAPGGISYDRTAQTDDTGRSILEQWVLHGAGHAWSGGSAAGSYTEPRGPDASREMVRFFLQHPA